MPNKKDAEFIRIVREPDSGMVNYQLIEIGLDSTLRKTGFVSEYYPKLVYEGILVSYEKGKKIQADTYEKGKLTGLSRHYYPNGKLKKTLDYSGGSEPRIVDFFDSTGVKLVENGTGYVKEYNKNSYEEGTYTNGVKTGKWRGSNKINDATFEEEYDSSGKFLSGVSVKSGVSYPYSKVGELPAFPGGAKAWTRFIERYNYPVDAVKARISGKVILNFVVNADGKLSDIKVVRPLFPSADEEAVRLLQKSPSWIPGKMRGIPVRVAYTQAIALNINP